MLGRKKGLIQESSGLDACLDEPRCNLRNLAASNVRGRRRLDGVNQKKLVLIAAEFFERLSAAGWIPALLMRLFVGYFFMETGWGKIHNLDAFATRFAQWGIPYPAFNAALSAYTEFFGGALTILGFGMRFVPIPMIINMIVAILTVKLKNVSGLNDFAELDEPLYALSFVWLFFSGAGWLSVDGFLKHVINSWLHQDKSQGIAQAPIAETSLIEDAGMLTSHNSH
jgi:putative oxidoreductase